MSHGGIIESLAGAVTADRLGFNASIALSLGFFVVGRHDDGDDDDMMIGRVASRRFVFKCSAIVSWWPAY